MGQIILTYTMFIRSNHLLVLGIMLSLLASSTSYAEGLTITHVRVSPQVLTIEKNEVATIQFKVSKDSVVKVKIFDAINTLVWTSGPLSLSAGEHSVGWPGRDNEGNPVVAEAYFYVIEASATHGEREKESARKENTETVIYDLTDVTGGENITLQNIRYDTKTKMLSFTAPKTGRYLLRAGIAQAFAIDSIINNKVVTLGDHEIPWDGYDASHVFDASNHPKLLFGATGFQLSSNVIVVKNSSKKISDFYKVHQWQEQPGATEIRESKKVIRDDLSANYYRPVNLSRDIILRVSLPESVVKNDRGAYVIRTDTPVTIDLLPEDIMVMEAQRGEMVLFLDGQLIHDNEVSYYPYNFKWSPKIYDGQDHILTVFLAGFAGNIGIATLKVYLDSSQKKAAQ